MLKFINRKTKDIQLNFGGSNVLTDLDNGDVAIKKFDRYNPDIVFIYKDVTEYGKLTRESINIKVKQSYFDVLYGNFFINKKGTRCFSLTTESLATDQMIIHYWQGVGSVVIPTALLYHSSVKHVKHAMSNKGNSGWSYVVIPKDFRYEPDTSKSIYDMI